jgi:hypothetical protein
MSYDDSPPHLLPVTHYVTFSELYAFCNNQIGYPRWAGHVERMGERRGVYRVLVRKPEGKRTHGRLKHRWEDHIKMDLQEVGCGGMDWIEMDQDRDKWHL